MVRSYSANETKKLTEHFKVSEFKCKCGQNHNTLIDDDLGNKLELLRSTLKCSKIVVNSGYRCPTHDRKVGGSGGGRHTQGYAADIVCYDQQNKIISSKIVSCVAQDIGFPAIANIDDTYTATHVDTRPSGHWYGDEVISKSVDVCSDFWSHYKIDKKDIYGEDAVKKTKQVTLTIDGVTYSGKLTEK